MISVTVVVQNSDALTSVVCWRYALIGSVAEMRRLAKEVSKLCRVDRWWTDVASDPESARTCLDCDIYH